MTFRLPTAEPLTDRERQGPSRYNVLDAAAGKNPWGDRPDEAQTFPHGAIDVSQTFRDADGLIAVVEPDGNIVEADDALQDASPDARVCDVCSAAKLAESGVMPSSVPADELHARCREPGRCACSCEFAKGGRCRNCHRTRTFEQLSGSTLETAECVDRSDCAKAMLDALTAPTPPKTPPNPPSATRRPPRPSPAPRPARARATGTTPCTCGCGETTGGGRYKPGHDARHVKNLVAAVRARGLTREAAADQLSDALKDKLYKQLGG